MIGLTLFVGVVIANFNENKVSFLGLNTTEFILFQPLALSSLSLPRHEVTLNHNVTGVNNLYNYFISDLITAFPAHYLRAQFSC